MASSSIIKRAFKTPSGASPFAEEIFKQVMKLETIRDRELLELRENYEGDHDTLVERYVQKPPPWDPATWAYVKRGLMHINSTKACCRTLVSGVYGGVQIRSVKSEKGPFAEQVNAFIATPKWRVAAKRVMREATLYGTAYSVYKYEKERRRFTIYHPNPVTTHILTDSMEPDVPIAVAEFDEKRNWVKIWAQEFYAVLSRSESTVEYLEYVDEQDQPVPLPYFPVHITRAEVVSGSPYGLLLLRDTPRFNRALAVSYFNVSFSSLMKAQALLAISSDDSQGESGSSVTQMGPHTALVLPKGAAAEFISSNADVKALMDVMDKVQELESYVLGIPALRAVRNQSAESASNEAIPLTSQVADLAGTMVISETEQIQNLLAASHWAVNSPAAIEDVERLYEVTVKITPRVNMASFSERVQNLTMLAERGVVPAVDVVSEFNPSMPFTEVQAQATVMEGRMAKPSVVPPNKEVVG